jgi:hypothetical protein
VLDTRPKPNCSQNSDCLSTEQCVTGYCRYTCSPSSTMTNQCSLIDARIPVCSSAGICVSQSEATPQCTAQSGCSMGQDCISNTCQ